MKKCSLRRELKCISKQEIFIISNIIYLFFDSDSETLKPRKMFNIFCQTLFNIRCTVSWITHNYFSKLKDRWDDIVKLNRQDFSQFKKEPFASAGPKKDLPLHNIQHGIIYKYSGRLFLSMLLESSFENSFLNRENG